MNIFEEGKTYATRSGVKVKIIEIGNFIVGVMPGEQFPWTWYIDGRRYVTAAGHEHDLMPGSAEDSPCTEAKG